MRCNACWQELEGRAVATTCNHLLCLEDANKILSSDGSCPICEQVLSKSLMKPIEISPNDEWVNMAMVGISPQILMRSAYRSVQFYIGQKELEMQLKMNKIVAQCRQKCEALQEKFTDKMEQAYTSYQKVSKRCQMIEQQMENLTKDKQELQEKYADKCRQKRKLDEMYDLARAEVEQLKRQAILPANHSLYTHEPDLFSNPSTRMNNRDTIARDWWVLPPETPGARDEKWSARQEPNSPFNMSGDIPATARQPSNHIDPRNRMPSAHSSFGVGNGSGSGSGTGTGNPSMTLKNLIFSPIKRPQFSRNRPQLFT